MTIETQRSPSMGFGWFSLAALFLVGAALDNVCRFYPAHLPFFLPWEFSWPVFIVTFVVLSWLVRGLARLPAKERPATWRIACFVLGVLANYAVLQTRFDYFAQHMFFIHRWDHFVLHHLAPILIAIGASSGVMRAGVPEYLRLAIDAPPLKGLLNYVQHPVIAPVLFVGVVFFWLIPSVHTRAMLDSNLHDAMDWTVALNGVFFWSLVLDARPKPPARLTYGVRMWLIVLVQLPQIALGAIIFLSPADVYPIYAICGRLLAMTALDDQRFGALVITLPTTLMSLLALLVVLICMRRSEAHR